MAIYFRSTEIRSLESKVNFHSNIYKNFLLVCVPSYSTGIYINNLVKLNSTEAVFKKSTL